MMGASFGLTIGTQSTTTVCMAGAIGQLEGKFALGGIW
jgi:hypothetical protein